ncbi:hypothetical protein CRG98_042481 [Punica granatum]|uniref:Uncharacterized protein n=1 Tax=Punica granatum TaxID=22663 RepID=A0A2I0I0Z2_PUNGR|nr:hypothetical protein CRG98_042481 [Punica granatum]
MSALPWEYLGLQPNGFLDSPAPHLAPALSLLCVHQARYDSDDKRDSDGKVKAPKTLSCHLTTSTAVVTAAAATIQTPLEATPSSPFTFNGDTNHEIYIKSPRPQMMTSSSFSSVTMLKSFMTLPIVGK